MDKWYTYIDIEEAEETVSINVKNYIETRNVSLENILVSNKRVTADSTLEDLLNIIEGGVMVLAEKEFWAENYKEEGTIVVSFDCDYSTADLQEYFMKEHDADNVEDILSALVFLKIQS